LTEKTADAIVPCKRSHPQEAGKQLERNVSGAVCALDVRSVSKSYGATVALQDLSIELHAGEVHALLGENGAGKSTLVKILSGVVRPNAGAMQIDGKPYQPHSIVDARGRGVATAFQELSLVPNLTVAQNLSLPRQVKGALGLVSGAATQRRGGAILERFDLRLRPNAIVADLTLAERQRLEIARAFACDPRVLILDEPTAALAETDWLFGLVRKVTATGASILYISHRLHEVRELCQRATVLRNGRSIGTVPLEDATDHTIFEMMVGRSQAEEMQRRVAPAQSTRPAVLEGEGLTNESLKDISLTLREGEILGVAGLEGQGQRELFRTLVGLAPLASGSVKVDGATVRPSGPDVALKTGRGMAFVPEERKTEGIFPALATATNIVLPVVGKIGRAGLVSERLEREAAAGSSSEVDLSPRYLDFRVGDLSGGNQQKAVLARAMQTGAKILLLYDPTRGVDVGTKQSIYAAIRRFAEIGGAVLLYSSELPELVHLADRCLVVYGGRIFAELAGVDINERTMVAALTGHTTRENAA
jgi:ribose transport system ATP-binding protein